MPHRANQLSTVIVGAGFSGLSVAIALKKRGVHDFVVLEKAAELGGTWRENVYPGCACDVQSHLYSYSFALNPEWTRMYAQQPEIQRYLHDCAARFDLSSHLVFDTTFESGHFDDRSATWQVTTSNGDYTCDYLVVAKGPLHQPRLPEVPGMESFTGTTFHSANWNHDYPLEGKRVAVVGTGASAVQFIPHVATQAAEVLVVQRTPPWVLPRLDRAMSRAEKWMFRHIPGTYRAYRHSIYWRNESRALAMLHPSRIKPLERLAKRHITRSITDSELATALTPNFTIGCKRILLSNDYYPALAQDHVTVNTTGLSSITADGVVTGDGQSHRVDAVIYGTGFHVTAGYEDLQLTGRDGIKLQDTWENGPHAYLGTTVAGFPNLFLMLGPNTGLGHSSMIFMAEAQTSYIMDAMGAVRRHRARQIEVRDDIQASYNAQLQRRLSTTVWLTGGCHSWYVDPDGVNRTLWPGYTFRFWWDTTRLRDSDYILTS